MRTITIDKTFIENGKIIRRTVTLKFKSVIDTFKYLMFGNTNGIIGATVN